MERLIQANQIQFRLSGGAANKVANLSLGGAMSLDPAALIVSGVKNALFDDVSGDQGADGMVDFRCFYVRNSSSELWQQVTLWIDSPTASLDDEIAVGLEPGALSVAAQLVTDELDAPEGVAFSQPSAKGNGIVIGNMPGGAYKAIWMRRTVNPGARAMANDVASIRVEGDTI